MNTIKILDSTLRDGGYINNWSFGQTNINEIIKKLTDSNLNYIECGYFKPHIEKNTNKTIFTNILDISHFLKLNNKTIYTLMVNFGDANIEDFQKNKFDNFELRVAFKPNKINSIKTFLEQLQNKNYKISLNPMHTSIYTKKEIEQLCTLVNELKISCLTVVDTMGIMNEKNTKNLFIELDKRINPETKLGFHSHNNLQLSYSNAKEIITTNLQHDIIIDSCILGIGRGAGILPTELITQYLNEYFNTNYNLNNISTIANKYIQPLEKFQKWGYSYPYYLSAKNQCHPNYAKYLIEHTNLSYRDMNNLFIKIPKNEKINFNEELLKTLL